MIALIEHALWPSLAPYIRVEDYDRDGGHAHPRHRLEVVAPANGILLRQLLAMEVPCAACGSAVHPVRQRQSTSVHLYLAVACPLDKRYACARSSAAAKAYDEIVAARRGWLDPSQPSLFQNLKGSLT